MIKTIYKLGFVIPTGDKQELNRKIEDVKKFLLKKLSCKSNFEICDEFDIQPRSLFLLLTRLGIKEKSDKSFRSGFLAYNLGQKEGILKKYVGTQRCEKT